MTLEELEQLAEVPACSHSVIKHRPFTDPDGVTSSKWICGDCGTQFAPVPVGVHQAAKKREKELVEALRRMLGEFAPVSQNTAAVKARALLKDIEQ